MEEESFYQDRVKHFDTVASEPGVYESAITASSIGLNLLARIMHRFL